MHIGADLGRVDNTVLFYEDMVTNVQREESHSATQEYFVCVQQTDTARHKITLWSLLSPDVLTDVDLVLETKQFLGFPSLKDSPNEKEDVVNKHN